MNATNKKRTLNITFLVKLSRVIIHLNHLLIAFVFVKHIYKTYKSKLKKLKHNKFSPFIFLIEFELINELLDKVCLEMDKTCLQIKTRLRINEKLVKQIRRLRKVYKSSYPPYEKQRDWGNYLIKLTDNRIAEIGDLTIELMVWCIETLKATASKKVSKKNELARKNLMERLESAYNDVINDDFEQGVISLSKHERWDYLFLSNPPLGEVITFLEKKIKKKN